MNMSLPDMQHTTPQYPLAIDRVGVDGLQMRLPLGGETVAATITATCALPPTQRGIHMSRFGESISEALRSVRDLESLSPLVAAIARNQQVESAQVSLELAFTWFLERRTPRSGLATSKPVDVRLRYDGQHEYLSVSTTETAVCPCSKAMSMTWQQLTEEEREQAKDIPPTLLARLMETGYGAHGQKSRISVELQLPEERLYVLEGNGQLASRIDRLTQLMESSASAPTFSLLKRDDEQHLTQYAYEHAMFVEDIARAMAHVLERERLPYRVAVRNAESIHSGDLGAVAEISGGRP